MEESQQKSKSNDIFDTLHYLLLGIDYNSVNDFRSKIAREIHFFRRALRTAKESMRVDEYGFKWIEDKSYEYKIYPLQTIRIIKKRHRLLLRISPSKFDPETALLNEKGKAIQYTFVSQSEDGVIIEIEETIRSDTTLYYGFNEVEWKPESQMITPDKIKEKLTDREGRTYQVYSVQDELNEYKVVLDYHVFIPRETELFVDNVKVEYEMNPKPKKPSFQLYEITKKGSRKVPFRLKEASKSIIIESTTRLGKYLKDSAGNYFYCNLIKEKDIEKKGIWIRLKEDEDTETSEGRSRMDIFFELLNTARDLEIWESPNLRYSGDKDKKIKVFRIDFEEYRLLVERKPVSERIYPPRSTYQIEMQLKAVETLLYRPNIAHRPLLKLFEPKEETYWETPRFNESVKDDEWFFLNEKNIDGCDEQRDFVLKALNTPDFALLEGPPGSGKTTTIAELIYQLLKRGKRVLLSASTHVAIDNVLEILEEKLNPRGGLMKNGIVPLRIGREEVISYDIKKYQIENRKKSFRKILEKESWVLSASEEEQEEYIEELVVRSSNLVCGTTIGILQYPPFKKMKKYIVPEFDYLILDEASKTTFLEFLVPAIFAKKWIIVGDIRQLSPYTDTLYLRVNLDKVVRDRWLKKALIVFLNLIFHRGGAMLEGVSYPPPNFIYVDRTEVIKRLVEIFLDKINELNETSRKKRRPLSYAFIISQKTITDTSVSKSNVLRKKIITEQNIRSNYASAKLINSELIFCDKGMYKRFRNVFPPTHILITTGNKNQEIHNYWHLHWYSYEKRRISKNPYVLRIGKNVFDSFDIIQEELNALFSKSWADELAWRMKRIQELEFVENIQGSKKYYLATMHALMPPKGERNYFLDIKKIGQVFLPSILKGLQEGITPDWRGRTETAIFHGFPEDVKTYRFGRLSYQHRMHPEISKIPRSLFYKEQALIDASDVKNKKRKWGYKRYRRRVIWIDVPRKIAPVFKNRNEKEAEVAIQEFEKFAEWFNREGKEELKKNKDKKSTYRVILLTFYEAQRKLIRDMLRERYPENERRQTKFSINGLDVRVYTVDKVQGREGDIVFLTMVQNRRVGFMDSPNRLNVALTRARYQLVIIGDYEYFKRQQQSLVLQKVAENVTVWRDIFDKGSHRGK